MNLDKFVKQSLEANSFYAEPFRHWIIENLIPDNLAHEIESEVSSIPIELWTTFNYEMQKKSQLSNLNLLPVKTKNLITYLNSADFLQKLEQITGIKNLISDPYLEGGGLHSLGNGGRLAIHADFSRHNKYKIYRRINLILYLNHNWKNEYNGNLSLYDKDATTLKKSVIPKLNRAVIFETNVDSYHGHPEPINCPENVRRKSIALYFYTIEKTNQVRGINTRWRNGDNKKPLLLILRKPLSNMIWRCSKIFEQAADKLEKIHTKIDIN
jgi:Rps23 Pro-64 3,4-dihydroxylase Tpa1-like proline 4-hydroxylase